MDGLTAHSGSVRSGDLSPPILSTTQVCWVFINTTWVLTNQWDQNRTKSQDTGRQLSANLMRCRITIETSLWACLCEIIWTPLIEVERHTRNIHGWRRQAEYKGEGKLTAASTPLSFVTAARQVTLMTVSPGTTSHLLRPVL